MFDSHEYVTLENVTLLNISVVTLNNLPINKANRCDFTCDDYDDDSFQWNKYKLYVIHNYSMKSHIGMWRECVIEVFSHPTFTRLLPRNLN